MWHLDKRCPFVIQLPKIDLNTKHKQVLYVCYQCIDAAHLMEEVGMTDSRGVDASSVPLLAAAIINHLRQGHCVMRQILPSPAFFTDYIFQSLNRTSDLHVMGNYKHIQVHTYRSTVWICREKMMLIVYSDLQQLLLQLGVGGSVPSKSQGRRMRSMTEPSSKTNSQDLLRGTRDWTQVLSFQRHLIQVKKSTSFICWIQVCCTNWLCRHVECFFFHLKFYILI